jgi:hypothetical protein
VPGRAQPPGCRGVVAAARGSALDGVGRAADRFLGPLRGGAEAVELDVDNTA